MNFQIEKPKLLLVIILITNVAGCVSSRYEAKTYEESELHIDTSLHKIDMSDFDLDQFKNQTECQSTSQCKSVPYGKGICSPYKGYLIYSTAMGHKNEEYLLEEVKKDRERDILEQKNSQEYEEMCTGAYEGKPLLFCNSDKVCENAFDIMSEQENQIYKLRRELDTRTN